jgi:hypothetical protein
MDERVGLAWVERLLEKHKEIMLPSQKNSNPKADLEDCQGK